MKGTKNSSFLTVVAALGVVIMASAFTSNPVFAAINFKSGPTCSINPDNSLTCTGRVTGLGNTASASLTASVDVLQGCINRGAHNQQPSGLQHTTTGVSVGPVALDVHNGGATYTLTSQPIQPTISCPDGMQPVVVCVTYNNIVVTISSSTGTKQSDPQTKSNC